jgi:NAD(P)-dependent dehydrogenase (short-subunit alcohol dehydrogenase family)
VSGAGGRLDGRVVALAGAGGSLGPYAARALADAGATVALSDLSEEKLDALVTDLALPQERIDRSVVDLLDWVQADAWATGLAARFGRVDAVVHAVGGWRGGKPIPESPREDWIVLEGLLVRTVQNTSRAFHEQLIGSEHGRFVLISAKQARRPTGTNAAYASAKAAAETWTYALAEEFHAARAEATANVVAINALVTPETRAASPEKDFRTFTDAQEVAAAIVYLLSDDARKMNGQRVALYDEAA